MVTESIQQGAFHPLHQLDETERRDTNPHTKW
jgi:hypothetical protein